MSFSFTALPRRPWWALAVLLWVAGALAGNVGPTGEIEELRFADFFRSPVGPAGLEISQRLARADGRTVRLVGYMVHQENAARGRFLLAPRPLQISEQADGEADDLPPTTVVVELDPTQRDWNLPHVRGRLALTGVLAVGRREDDAGRVSWVRLQLPPEAVRRPAPQASAENPATPPATH